MKFAELNDKYEMHPVLDGVSILAQIKAMADLVTEHYAGLVGEVVLVPVLTGAMPFASDLLRNLRRPLTVEPVRVSTYKGNQEAVEPAWCDDDLSFANGRHVLIVEDILDTGATLAHLYSRFRRDTSALSVEAITLLRKKGTQRFFLEEPRWVGFTLPGNIFAVGYGLDIHGFQRNMPFIASLTEKKKGPPKIEIFNK
jgi:hypoxanthine phosphoribosyltransferase